MPQPRQHSAHGRMPCLPRILSRRANRCHSSGGCAASAGAAWLHQSGRRPANTKESGESGRGWQSPASGGGSASASASASAAGSPARAPSAPPPPPAVGSPPLPAASAAASASAAAAAAAAAGASGTHPLQQPPSSSGSARGRPRAATWCTRALQARADAAAWRPAGARRRAARSPAHLLVSSGTRRALFKRARSHHTPLSTGGRAPRAGGAPPHPPAPAGPPPPPPHPPSDVGTSRRPAGPRAWLQRQRGRRLRRRRCILGLLRGQARLAASVPRGPAARARLAQQRRAGAPARLERAQLGGRAACAARGPGAWRRAPAMARRRGALAPPGHTHARRPVATSCCGRLCCVKTVRAVALGRQGACARSRAPAKPQALPDGPSTRQSARLAARPAPGRQTRARPARAPRPARCAPPAAPAAPAAPARCPPSPEPAGTSRSLYRLTIFQAEAIALAQGWAGTDAQRVPAAGRGRAARRAAAARARPPCERRQGRRPVERAPQRGGRAAGAHRVGQQAHPVALRLRHNGCWRALPLAPRLLPRQRLPAQPQGALRGPAETSDPAGQAAARLPAPPSRCNRTGAPALRNPTRAAQGSQACAGVARQGAQSRQPAATGQRTPSQGRFARQGGAGLARGGRAPAARPHSPGAARRPPPRRRRRRTAARPGTRATGARCRHGASARAASAPAPARAQSSSFQYVCKV